ncbi:hypothetical protein TREMEDRAFT_57395, partial [Tremella mesenterica DSM 1558]|uniref:uncharacterized protein n=1 Tax=Tremella mesenterica (strain ATCC 24925 / CBS 8224 / DSM 1558 / NBRC 9311 / NRRL Y-6157 / RJB 2259-6 / UBC 559-6) TaxID=578456 RepID=UPI0003F49F9D
MDNGRVYQAQNDDYMLPVDEDEREVGLQGQHYALKVRQGGKNYLAPFQEVLPEDGRDCRLLDVGTGTGIWALEMASEFPEAEVTGVDLAPVQRPEILPNNLSYLMDDVSKGIPFPDGYFDAVHSRLLLAGIRNWKSFINEVIRVVRPGGLIVFVEDIGRFWVDDVSPEESRKRAPGVSKWSDYIEMALTERGFDSNAGSKAIPKLIEEHTLLSERQTVYTSLPLWPWSTDPLLKKTGELMIHDTLSMPETARLLVVDGCSIPNQRYDELVADYMADIGRPGANVVLPVWHHWARKKV